MQAPSAIPRSPRTWIPLLVYGIGAARTRGSLQGDAARRPDSAFVISSGGAHTHVLDMEATASRNHAAPGAPVATYTVASPSLPEKPKPTFSSSGSHSHSLSGGDPETRPEDAAVCHYIKVR